LPATDDSANADRPQRASARTLALLGAIAVLVYGLDQGAKYLILENLAVGERTPVLGELLQFQLVKNSGAAFSLLSGSTWIFAIIASVVVVFIVVFAHRIRSVAWASVFGLLLGGTLGNLHDRLFREPGFGIGHVIDFLQLYAFPAIFNLADVAICSAMAVFIVLSLRGIGLDGSRAPRPTPTPPATPPADEKP
jgi:signal peptidase II